MKKYLLVFFLTFVLIFQVQNVFADSNKDELITSFKNNVLELKDKCDKDKCELINKFKVETDEDLKKDLVSKIENLMIFQDADFNVKEIYTSGEKTKYIVEVSHQWNIANWMNYYSRLKQAKELCIENEECEPYDLEVKCLQETLDLCKNKRTNCTVEFENNLDGDISTSSYISILKSIIF